MTTASMPWLRQQVVVIDVAFGIGRGLRGPLEIGLIDFGDRHALGAELLKVLLEIPAAPAGADQAV